MAITVNINNGDLTLTLQYVADTTKAQKVLTNAAQFMYINKGRYQQYEDEDLILFDDLTNQQRLSIIDNMVKDYILHRARSYVINDNIIDANDTSETEIANNHSLG